MTIERQPDTERISALLHEYDALRAEIVARAGSRFQLVALVGVVATLVTAKWASGSTQTWIIIGTLIGTAVTALIIWLAFGTYIDSCASRLIDIENEVNRMLGGLPVLKWESRIRHKPPAGE